MIILDLIENLKLSLIVEKQIELLGKIRKPTINFTREEKERNERIRANDMTGRIVDVKLAEDGSTRMYLYGEKHPVRIYVDSLNVSTTALYKRLIPLFAQRLASMGWLGRLVTLVAIHFNKELLYSWLGYIFEINMVLLKEEHYSQPTKEVRRVLKGKIDQRLLDAIALIIESDMAYRYRFQDIVSEINKDAFEKNPIKEIKRLFEIMKSRELLLESASNKFKRFVPILLFYLRINRGLTKQIKDIVRDLNIDEIKPSIEDIYWMNYPSGYNYRGLSNEVRKKLYEQEKNR